MKNYVLPIIIIVVGLGVSGFLLFGGSTESPAGSQAGEEISKENLRKLDLKIEGMFCVGCSGSVGGAVSAVPGVVRASASSKTDSGEVIYDSTKTSKEELVNLPIFETYPATVVSDEKFKGDTSGSTQNKIPSKIKSKLDELAKALNKTGSQLTQDQSKRLDRAVSNKSWDKVSSLVDKYLDQYGRQ